MCGVKKHMINILKWKQFGLIKFIYAIDDRGRTWLSHRIIYSLYWRERSGISSQWLRQDSEQIKPRLILLMSFRLSFLQKVWTSPKSI